MKKQYIAPKSLLVNLKKQGALMAGSITERLKTTDVMDGGGFVQHGRAAEFVYDDDFDE